MSEDNAKLIAELLPRIDALLRNDLCKLYPLIVPILEDCRAALSVPSAPEVEAMVRRLRNFESFRAFELADMLESLDRRAALSAQSESPYPTGNVNGPCVCGSWPGGPCFRCPRIAEPGATEGED